MPLLAVDLTWLQSVSLPGWAAIAAVVTGSLVGAEFAAQRGFDPIGVFGLAFAQGLGGLMLLELLLLNGSPQFLRDPKYLVGTAVASVAGFFFSRWLSRSQRLLMVLDSLSMGCFVTVGVAAGLELQLPAISAVFLGVLTATGGVVLRDVLAGTAPSMLRPGVLVGIAALVGAVVYVALADWTTWPDGLEQVLTAMVVFAVRVLSAWRGWHTKPTREISDRLWETIGPDSGEDSS